MFDRFGKEGEVFEGPGHSHGVASGAFGLAEFEQGEVECGVAATGGVALGAVDGEQAAAEEDAVLEELAAEASGQGQLVLGGEGLDAVTGPVFEFEFHLAILRGWSGGVKLAIGFFSLFYAGLARR